MNVVCTRAFLARTTGESESKRKEQGAAIKSQKRASSDHPPVAVHAVVQVSHKEDAVKTIADTGYAVVVMGSQTHFGGDFVEIFVPLLHSFLERLEVRVDEQEARRSNVETKTTTT